MQLRAFAVGGFQVNCFVVTDPVTGDSALVDTGEDDDIVHIVQALDPEPRITAILLTHAHVDHAGGLAAIQRVWDVPTYLGALDRPLFEALPGQGNWFCMPSLNRPCGRIHHWLQDGAVVRVGELALNFVSTPGHAPGHGCFHDDEDLLAGDLLFAGSIGRTDFPLCDPGAMEASLARIMALPLSLRVHSGHGPSTTLERELNNNPFLRSVRQARGMAEPRRGGWSAW